MAARKQFDVQYQIVWNPRFSAKCRFFNQVQRGHQNMFESAIFYVPMSIVAGLKHPLTVLSVVSFIASGAFINQDTQRPRPT